MTDQQTIPKRRPFWFAVIMNVLFGRPFWVVMHRADGDWVTCDVGDSFGRALWFHRTYRKQGFH